MKRAALLLMALAIPACNRPSPVRKCEACIEREGGMYCGRSYTRTAKFPDVTEEDSKISAGKAACVELAARKGSGYAGPVFKEVRDACAEKLTVKDLRRARCEDDVLPTKWNPRAGVDQL